MHPAPAPGPWTELPYQGGSCVLSANDRYTICVASKKPVGIIVRRGALRRFDALVRKTADLPVVVSWDRRTEHRRASCESAPVERRSSDRRKTPPFTWDAADFVVADAAPEPDTTAPARITRLDSGTASKAGIGNQELATVGATNRTEVALFAPPAGHPSKRKQKPKKAKKTAKRQ